MYNIKASPLKDKSDYEKLCKKVDELMLDYESLDEEELLSLEFYTYQISLYEKEHFAHERLKSPATAVRSLLELRGTDERDIKDIFGTKAALALFFHGKKQLTADQVRKLHERLGVPLTVLLGMS